MDSTLKELESTVWKEGRVAQKTAKFLLQTAAPPLRKRTAVSEDSGKQEEKLVRCYFLGEDSL